MREKTKVWMGIFVSFLMVFACVGVASSTDIYYDVPSEAYPTIQSAIDAAISLPTGSSNTAYIRVARGTYEENLTIEPETDGVYNLFLQGGYDGEFTSRTVDPANTVIDGTNSGRAMFINSPYEENGVQLSMTIEGFTITGGNDSFGSGVRVKAQHGYTIVFDHMMFENNEGSSLGGGLWISCYGEITVQNSTIKENKSQFGAGINMEVYSRGYAKVANNIFENNNDNNSGGSGAGMSLFTYDNAVAVVEHNLFKENTAGNSAGFNVNAQGDENAVSEYGSQVTVIDNQFYKNTATSSYSGGAGMRLTAEDGAVITAKNNMIYNNTGYSGAGVILCSKDTSQIVFTNNLIHENEAWGSWAGGGGGSLDSYNSGEIEFTNNTVTANVSPFSGGGLDIHQHDNGTINIVDSIIWGNSISGTLAFGENLYIGGDSVSSVTLSYCLFNEAYPTTGWTDGGHNITGDAIDPLFVTSSLGDYYLSQEGAGQVETSPCVDAGGDTAVALGLDQMTTRTDDIPDTGTVDIGYHYPKGMVQPVPGDADGDGDVDGTDLAGFAAAYGSFLGDPNYVKAYDIDGTPGIGEGDLVIFADHFGEN